MIITNKTIEPHQLKEQIHPLPFQTHTLCQPVSYHAPEPLSEISRSENVKRTSLGNMEGFLFSFSNNNFNERIKSIKNQPHKKGI